MTDRELPSKGDGQQGHKEWYKRMRYQIILFAGGIAVFGLVLGLILHLYIDPQTSTQKKDLVQALGLITAGVAGATGIFFTWRGQNLAREAQERNQRNTQEQLDNAQDQLKLTERSQEMNQKATQAQLKNAQEELRLTREGQITERFTRAIDQLGQTDDEGNELFEIRLGGIYALDRIARESEADYWSVIEVLTAYVRTNVPWPPTTASKSSDNSEHEKDLEAEAELSHQHRRLDIQAILYILRDRKHHYGSGEDKYIRLTHSDLRNGDLREIHLERARLRGTNLKGARLDGARLWRARLRNTIFEEASLEKAQLQKADLEEAILCKADLEGANLQGADFEGANLQGADLRKANLQGAKALTQKQIDAAFGNERTKLPEGRQRPAVWSKPIEEQRAIQRARVQD
jgi:hypothetical protein